MLFFSQMICEALYEVHVAPAQIRGVMDGVSVCRQLAGETDSDGVDGVDGHAVIVADFDQ